MKARRVCSDLLFVGRLKTKIDRRWIKINLGGLTKFGSGESKLIIGAIWKVKSQSRYIN